MRIAVAGGVLALILGYVEPVHAQRMGRAYMSRPVMGSYRPYYPSYHYAYSGGRMPGWDWWRTYPWSAYNAWRNPYWFPPYNTNYPYAPYEAGGYGYVYPYASYYPSGVTTTYTSGYSGNPAPDGVPSDPLHHVEVPTPSGPVHPPPDAAVVRLEIPDEFGTVLFDGVKSSSVGLVRYYVTPQLQPGNSQYTVKASFTRNGQPVTEERTITVAPGRTTTVNFNRAVKK
jgi:uncharacterized protein (TIGR03000 family)